ncbi:MAG: hypothetical protein IPG50_15785 [Myxococcales bacterium]|nr:hypothetical protein [Myxococcales bacterium]
MPRPMRGAPGAAGPPAKGGRCDDWRYPGNDAYDGEWIETGGGMMIAHLDSDTTDNGNDFPSYPAVSSGAAPGVLPCGGVSRHVACCK